MRVTGVAAALLLLVCSGPLSMRLVHAQSPISDPAPAAPFVAHELIVRVANHASGAIPALLAKLGATEPRGFQTVDGLFVITLPPGLSVSAAARVALQIDGVVYAEPNYIVTTTQTPNDPRFVAGDMWGLQNTGQLGGTPGADIHATQAWAMTTGSSAVVVAVIDTGIDYLHQDLAANMFRNEADCDNDGIDTDGNGFIDDCHGIDTANNDSNPLDDNSHGTHTAGTIGAAGNNGVGVVGVNWQVKLMPCKFLAANGMGSISNAVACLNYVAQMKDRGVNIVATSNSWGGGGFSQTLYDAIDAQRQRGILFIAAAGNDTANNDTTPAFPADYDLPNVIAVAATDRSDALSSFSNRGRRTVHLGAPGSDILSTTPGDQYSLKSGTSMATPHVSGVAALLKANNPSLDWRAIRNLLLAGADDNPNLAATTITGKRLNAFKSLTCSNSAVFSRLKPIPSTVSTTAGTGITLSALNINCALGAGNVIVTVSPGNQTVTLTDDGVAPDQGAGDGIYSGSFVPASTGQFTLTFPNAETVTVQSLAATSYTVLPAQFAYRTIGGTNLGLVDDTSAPITPPFPIQFGGGSYTTLFVSSNGNINFTAPFNEFANTALPPPTQAGPLVAAFWDDLLPGGSSTQNVFWDVLGTAPNRELVVEWRDLTGFLNAIDQCAASERVTFEAVFFEGSSRVLFNYADPNFGGSCVSKDRGASATIGIQQSSGVFRQFSFNVASVDAGTTLAWTIGSGGSPSPFTDDPLVSGATVIKAVHFMELRTRIDALRARFALGGFAWTDPSLTGVTIKGVHVTELRTALSQAYSAAGLQPPTFADDVSPGVLLIRRVHVEELRSAVTALEAS